MSLTQSEIAALTAALDRREEQRRYQAAEALEGKGKNIVSMFMHLYRRAATEAQETPASPLADVLDLRPRLPKKRVAPEILGR